jgi:hypothetical protein
MDTSSYKALIQCIMEEISRDIEVGEDDLAGLPHPELLEASLNDVNAILARGTTHH